MLIIVSGPRFVRTVAEWVSAANNGDTRILQPTNDGCAIYDEPIVFNERCGVDLIGCAANWLTPRGWGRDWWASGKCDKKKCLIGFDDRGWPANTPCIQLQGCRSFRFGGFNIFRHGPGLLFHDTNIAGNNSADHEFWHVGFGTRFDAGDVATVDPFVALSGTTGDSISGFGTLSPNNAANRAGYYGFAFEGNNGTDNAQFYKCEFMHLERPQINHSPQTTRVLLQSCFFRYCDTWAYADVSPNIGTIGGEATSSLNVTALDCSWYDTGPAVIRNTKEDLSAITVLGGWYDTSDAVARCFIDAENHGSVLDITVEGLRSRPISSGAEPWIKRKSGDEDQTRLQQINPYCIPKAQNFYGTFQPTRLAMPQYVVTLGGAPSTSVPELSLHDSRCFYRRTDNGEFGIAVNNGGTIQTRIFTTP